MDEVTDAPSVAIAEYNPVAAGLADLRHRFKGVVFDLATTKGNAEARAARLELVRLRGSLEAKRKELKAPALERAKLIDTEARRIQEEILQLEDPIDAAIRQDEARREAERKAKADAEAKRDALVGGAMDRLRNFPVRASHKGSVVIEALLEELVCLPIADNYPQLLGEGKDLDAALALHERMIVQLRGMLGEAVAAEAEARRLREERAELDRERKEQEQARAAEDARRAQEQRIEDERLAEERRRDAEAAAAEIAAQRAEQARLDAAAAANRKRQQDELDRLAEEQSRLARLAREREEAAERERLEAERVARAEREAAEAFERDWLDAIGEDGRRTAQLEHLAQIAREERERQAEIAAAQARDAARHKARGDALELVHDLAGMPSKPPIKTVWVEIRARAELISEALQIEEPGTGHGEIDE